MIRIVGKGYKYILVQLIDYFGTVNEITISLKSETGKKEYTKLFGKPLKLQKEKIKVRIISIKQSTLSDFFRIPIKSSLTMKTTTSDHGYEIYSACGIKHKLLFPEKIKIKKSKNHAISIFQTKISDFLEDGFAFLNKKVRIPYKIKPVLPNSSDYMEGALPATQIIAIQNYKSFKGYIGNMFALNPSIDEFFRRIQDIEGYNPQTDTLNFNNIIKLEIARCKLGYTNFDSFITEFNQNPKIRIELGIQSQKQLTSRSYQRNLTAIGSSLKEYGEILIQECRDLKLIGGKIAIWDRRFFECNSNGMKFKETGMFSDPDAGHYVKKTGKYSVLSGTGYTDSCIVDDWWMLPIYWDAVSANKNDNTIFRSTADDFLSSTDTKPIFLIGDAGPDSHKSNKVVIDHGVIPIIAARANSVGEILKTDSGNHFRGEYIPRMYHRLLGKLYDLRTTVERKNSNEVVGHHRSKMSNRGIEQARIFVSISNITALLTALTAFKVGRLDLIRSPSVFRRLSI
jgi:hypothetical protein